MTLKLYILETIDTNRENSSDVNSINDDVKCIDHFNNVTEK